MANNLQFRVSPPLDFRSATHTYIRTVPRAVLHTKVHKAGLLCYRMGRPERLTGWPAYTAPYVFTRPRHRLHYPHHKCLQYVVSRTNCRPYLDPNCFASALFYSHHLPSKALAPRPPHMKLI